MFAKHHGEGLVDPGQGGGERRRSAGTIALMNVGAVSASDANLAVIDELGASATVYFRRAGLKDLHALISNEA